MILLLVVAILVLLALLGTAYILMARADKHATYAANAAANMGLAQKAVLSMVRSTMLYQNVDGVGSMLGANYGYYAGGITYPVGAVVEVPPNFGSVAPATYVTTCYQSLVANNLGNTPTASPADWKQILAARAYDYPEGAAAYNASTTYYGGELVSSQAPPWGVYAAIPATVTGVPLGTGSSWQPVSAEGWLVGDLPMEPNTNYAVGQAALLNGTQYICTTANTTPSPLTSPPSTSDWEAAATFFSGTPSAQVNYYSGLAPEFDPATGGYDLPSTGAASVVQPSVILNKTLNPSNAYPYGTRDAIWEMLPYSSPNGTRYRFALRIIDSNSMLNLNAGSAGDIPNTSGQYFNGAQLEGAMAAADVSAGNTPYIINGNGTVNGRAGSSGGGNYATLTTSSTFLPAWAEELFTYQAPEMPGVQWYSLATELELRSYGNSGGGFNGGTPYDGRPLQLWPNTLGYPSGLAAANRAFYTTYSWDRSFRRIGDIDVAGMPLTLGGQPTCASPAGTAGEAVWPTFPEKIWVNEPSVATTSANMANTTAKTATDLARVLLTCGYSGQEAVAFAANYMNYMYDAGTETAAGSGSSAVYTYTPPANGPSFVDDQGICVRGGTAAQFAGAGDLTSALAGATLPAGTSDPTVTGYSAQPFIVEAAVNATVSGTTVSYNESAVELYNPYGTGLNIGGWEIGVLNSAGTGYNTTYTIPANTVIPANSYLAIQSGAATPAFSFEGPPPAAQILTAASAATLAFTSTAATACNAVLLRPFTPRAGGIGYLPVDEFNVAPFETAAPGNNYLSRDGTGSAANPWGPWDCADALQTPTAATQAYTTPPAPAAPATSPVGIPLYDRFADQTDSSSTAFPPASYLPSGELPGYTPGVEPVATTASSSIGAPSPFIGAPLPLLNIADFNRITRLISVSAFSSSTSVYVPIQMISQTIEALPKNALEPSTELQYEANARFDFLQPTNATPPDPRALDVLKMITMTNPACDPDLNQNPATLDAIRMAGRINVNTASLPVLEDLFASVGNSTNAAALAGLIVDCRDRIGPSFTNNTGTTNPGSGICSMGQLLDALNNHATTATTLDNRDWTWGTIYNMCTVRSDTFVVYGLIQALRLNGNYVPPSGDTTVNTTDWYTANQGVTIENIPTQNTISTDPDNPNAEFILQGQRRFAAIIDRSYCNLGPGQTSASSFFQLPKVVALKVLGN